MDIHGGLLFPWTTPECEMAWVLSEFSSFFFFLFEDDIFCKMSKVDIHSK